MAQNVNNDNFFVEGLKLYSQEVKDVLKPDTKHDEANIEEDTLDVFPLESDEVFYSTDLICEGPVEGLVDKEGNNLQYIDAENISDISLGKGVYFNNVPIIDSKLKKFNFVTAGFSINYGDEFQGTSDIPSTVYRYNTRLYLADENAELKVTFRSDGGNGTESNYAMDYDEAYLEGGYASDAKNAAVGSLGLPNYISYLDGFFTYKRIHSPMDVPEATENAENFGEDPVYLEYAGPDEEFRVGFNKKVENNFNLFQSVDGESSRVFEKKWWVYIVDTYIQKSKQNVNIFTHKIRNKYCDLIKVQVGIDELYKQSRKQNSTQPLPLGIAVEVTRSNSADSFVCIFGLTLGYSRSSFVLDVPIKLKLNPFNSDEYYVSVFMLNSKLHPDANADANIKARVASIVERVENRGKFSYPFSVCAKTAISSRHFSQDPARSYDMKLLKIKIPNNYDPEAKTYTGVWNGRFDNFLKWTDNPAWVFYDICTNNRYGVGGGKIFEKDINKWDLYKIANYCDELVLATSPYKYPPEEFILDSENPNIIYIERKGRSTYAVSKQYPSVTALSVFFDKDGNQFSGSIGNVDYDSSSLNLADLNGGIENSILFMFNMQNSSGQKIQKNYKKIIWSVSEGFLTEDGFSGWDSETSEDSQGTHFRIQLINDFGPRKAFERDGTGILLKQYLIDIKRINDSNVSFMRNETDIIRKSISQADYNTENKAKRFILDTYKEFIGNNTDLGRHIDQIIREPIIPNEDISNSLDSSGKINKKIMGLCVPKSQGYRDALEPRFTANVLIENETECLKVLDDIASIFRGISYYKNGFLTATVDVDKPPAYIFNNTNVKNGTFTYATGSLDGNYSVAKVLYKDKFNLFDDQVEIIEDAELVKNYGIITKEILGFGVTSRDQAKRLGTWLLATNRFENQTVTFITDIQGLLLKPSDIIEIEDEYKNSTILQGRVTSVNTTEKYVVVDRKLNVSLAGSVIKFLTDKTYKQVKDITSSSEISDSDRQDIIEFKIDRIENHTNRVYIDKEYNIDMFNSVISSTPFIIKDVNDTNSSNGLYKIVSISEEDVNEYSVFCIKHSPVKYENIEKNIIVKNSDFQDNTILYSQSDSIVEFDASSLSYELNDNGQRAYWTLSSIELKNLPTLSFDYSINESESYLFLGEGEEGGFARLTIDFNKIAQAVQSSAQSGNEYYKQALNVFEDGGGFICKIRARNQSVKFKISFNDFSSKSIFMGKYPSSIMDNYNYFASSIELYLYNKNEQIIQLNV